MFSREVKFVLTALFTGLSVWQFIEGNIGNGIWWLLLALLIVLFIFKNERLLLIFYYLRKNNMEKSQQILDGIKKPEKLMRADEAYYYYLNGLLQSQKGIAKSEKFFKKALSVGLRFDHDKAIAKLNLAGIAASKRRKRDATNLIAEAKKLDKRNMLKDQIKTLQHQLKRI
ncbi:MAG: tetratricopeptide (TPR) repeat protein [Flavobacteriales bacterium]|jgi:tetratricopeptide (TPR) repeat protein